MDRNLILHLFNEQYSLFVDNLNKAAVRGDAEFIHQFRVAVKRLLGLRIFLSSISGPGGETDLSNLTEPIKPFYKSGGKVRNLQVITETAALSFQHRAPRGFMNYLGAVTNEKKVSFLELTRFASTLPEVAEFNEMVEFMLDKYYRVSESCFMDHIIANRLEALHFLQSYNPGNEWHDARAHIKRNYLLFQMVASCSNGLFDEEQMMVYRRLEQILGRWHDMTMLEKAAEKYELLLQFEQSEWSTFKKEMTEYRLNYEQDVRQDLYLLGTF